ncbi:uncharacterized protein FFE2_16054 [Fusarium fujikuroi]|nr:uncharacterized protein FFE2_16054 [Fusarium fujikuroi]
MQVAVREDPPLLSWVESLLIPGGFADSSSGSALAAVVLRSRISI